MTTRKLHMAMVVYCVLTLGGFVLDDARMRLVLWIFLAGLACQRLTRRNGASA